MRRSLVGLVAGTDGAVRGGVYGNDGLSAEGPVVGPCELDGGMGGPAFSRAAAGEFAHAAGTLINSMSVMPSASMSRSRVWTNAIWRPSGDHVGKSSLNS